MTWAESHTPHQVLVDLSVMAEGIDYGWISSNKATWSDHQFVTEEETYNIISDSEKISQDVKWLN